MTDPNPQDVQKVLADPQVKDHIQKLEMLHKLSVVRSDTHQTNETNDRIIGKALQQQQGEIIKAISKASSKVPNSSLVEEYAIVATQTRIEENDKKLHSEKPKMLSGQDVLLIQAAAQELHQKIPLSDAHTPTKLPTPKAHQPLCDKAYTHGQ